jgi:flagellar hook-associated protein 2
MAIRLSGMASGLDTDAIVKDLVKAYSTKKDKFVKQQTKTTWIMDSWKDVNTKVYGFYTNTLSNMRYSTNYNLRSATISNSNIAQVSASTGAVTSTQTLAVKQLATSGYLTGGKIEGNGAKVTNSTKLSDLGITEGTIMINDRKIELKGDMSLASLTSQFKAGEVSANFDEGTGRFFISSKTSGLDAEFSLTSGDAKGFEALQKLGLVSYKDLTVTKLPTCRSTERWQMHHLMHRLL